MSQKLYKVKVKGEPLMVVIGEIVLFDSATLVKKDNTHYFNASEVVYVLDITNDDVVNPPYKKS